MHFIRALTGIIIVLLTGALPTRAEIEMPFYFKQMLADADTIVLARPVQVTPGVFPRTYRVTEVLMGQSLAVGDQCDLPEREYIFNPGSILRAADGSEDTPAVREVLLAYVLAPQEDGNKTIRLASYGVRGVSEAGVCYYPEKIAIPGHCFMLPAHQDEDWDSFLRGVRRDTAMYGELQRISRITRHAMRNAAIFAWLREYLPRTTYESRGWRTGDTRVVHALPQEMWRWIYESGDLAASWQAVELQSNLGYETGGCLGVFARPAGRSLLLAKLTDRSLPDTQRLAALSLLQVSMHGYYPTDAYDWHATKASPSEQVALLEALLPLFRHARPDMRQLAIECLPSIGDSRHKQTHGYAVAQLALPTLIARYKEETCHEVRVALIRAIADYGGESSMEALNGNPGGATVVITNAEIDGDQLRIGVSRIAGQARLTDVVVLLYSRDSSPRRLQPSVSQPDRDGQWYSAALSVPLSHFPENFFTTIRVEAKTEAGTTWQSEYATLDLSTPRRIPRPVEFTR